MKKSPVLKPLPLNFYSLFTFKPISVYYYDIGVVLHTGGLAKSGHADDTVHTDARGDEKRPYGGDAHRPQGVEAAHQKRTAERPWVLHVPDKH